MKFFLLLLTAVSLSFAQWGPGGGGAKTLQNSYKKMSVSGRDIYVYAPSGLAAKSPLLFSLHGMDQSPQYQQENTLWEEVADTAGFVVVYPQGGTSLDTWDIQGDKDTKWIEAIIDQMVLDYDIDVNRVYLSGFSMGGMFSYNAISYIGDKIAAIAPCSGWNVYGAKEATRPVPIFHVHGTSDKTVSYDQLEDFLSFYRNQYNCPKTAEVQENWPHQGDLATLYTWGPCDDGIYVKHLKLQGRDHLPSHAEVSDIWNFLKEYSLEGATIAPRIVVPTDREYAFNGSFSDSLKLSGWKLQNHSGEGSLKHSDGKAEINVTKVGTNAYDVQMIQNGVHYENGESYKLTFEASASAARTLEVNLEKDTDPWTSYLDGAKTFEIGTEPKTFEITFTMNEPTDENGRISFNAGLALGSVFIDNVVLVNVKNIDNNPGETNPGEKNDNPGSGDLAAIANGKLLLNAERTFSVYNMKGTFVCKLSGARIGDVQMRLNSMNLDKGLYVVKDGSFKRIYSVK